ncbi:MAG: glycoside hydrolase family 15 protein [Thermoleophilaceae bacterium]|nr:glycoside hydrolase family 15 protein [Thermoleophilaceae bacterium]
MSAGDYALLSDCQGAALVSRGGSVDWWSSPRFDSPSIFSRMLDPEAGHFSVRPTGDYTTERRYLPDSMVLESVHTATTGTVRVRDALAFAPGARGHEIGLNVSHALVRVVDAVEGRPELEIELVPRPEYGLVSPKLVRTDRGVVSVGGCERMLVETDVELEPQRAHAGAQVRLAESGSVGFVLHRWQGLGSDEPDGLDPFEALENALEGWRSWAELHRSYEGEYRELVARSALVLQALTYRPSGAVVAAATTSLPEVPGGDSNWDYRYGWLRDSSLLARALQTATCQDESHGYLRWMTRAALSCASTERIGVVFGVEGERDLSERELDHLAGHEHSSPVRTGNEAWRQRQLDVYGEVVDVAHLLREDLEEIDAQAPAFVAQLADRAAEEWDQPDSGMWEGREGERRYLHSRLMCWVALERALDMVGELGPHAHPETWEEAREEIRRAILDEGWHEQRGAYTGAVGSDHLDASVLMMALVGFVDPDDERMRATVAAIEEELVEGGLARRYTGEEDEGAFLLVSYWLAECYARRGDTDRARQHFERATGCANDLGLLAEMAVVDSGEPLGNIPQALSHVGLINAAAAIDAATAGRGS